jgi:beta-N-acetylhexosaminidase
MPEKLIPQQLLSKMTLAEKVGQVFVFTWRNLPQALNDMRLHPGGYIRIYSDALTVARESAEIQAASQIPLIMAADFERGIGGTVQGPIEIVTAMALGATADERAAFDAGQMIGQEALAIGINMDYAPVFDINSNPQNPVINTRSFGSDPDLVARLGVAFTKGLQSAGVATCGKHFPGHGNTHIDSHSNLGTISGSREELHASELHPFKAAITAGVDSIMSAHLLVPALEPERLPATLSRRIMTGLLRDELGFTGVAVSDALDMGAIAKNFSPEQSVPMAINAGCDQLVMPQDNALVTDILISAVKRGEVSEERLNEAVLRNLLLKERRGILHRAPAHKHLRSEQVNTADHRARVQEIAEQSIVLAHDSNGIVPLRPGSKILCLEISSTQAERSYYLEPHSFADHLARDGWQVSRRSLPGISDAEADAVNRTSTEKLSAAIDQHDIVILTTYASIRLKSGTVGLPDGALSTLKKIPALASAHMSAPPSGSKPVILASFGSPYVLSNFPGVDAALCAFSETQASQAALARALRGEIPCRGKMPVEL